MARRELWALGAITAVAAILRFPTLDAQSLWLDEAFTHKLAGDDLGGLLRGLPEGESNPPLYQVLAWLWAQPLGNGEVALRSLSALIGTVTVPAAYLATERLLEPRARILLAALVAVHPLLVWYSQEARGYALVVLMVVVGLGFFARALHAPSGRALAGWAAASSAAIATHYFAVFAILAEAVWLVMAVPPARRRALAASIAAPAITAVALLPLALAQRANGGASGVGDAPLLRRLGEVPRKFLVGEYGGPVRGLAPLAALLVLVSVALLAARGDAEHRRRATIPLALGSLTIAIPLALAVFGFDYFTTRYVLIALIPLLAVAAAGLAAPRSGGLAATSAGATAVLIGTFCVCTIAVPLTPRLGRDDWRGAADALGEPLGSRAIVVSPAVGFVPLRVYEAEIEAPPASPFPVTEVDVIAMTRADQPPLPAPARGLERFAERRDATYVVTRFRARPGTRVSSPALAGRAYPGGPASVVYERNRR